MSKPSRYVVRKAQDRISLCCTVLLALSVVFGQAQAADNDDSPFPFPLTGIVAGQTMRISVINVTPASLQKAPCVATMSFVDDKGSVIPVNGAPTTAVSLASGASTFVDLPAPDTASGGVQNRAAVRPVVLRGSSLCLFRASATVFNRGSGQSLVAMPQDPTLPPGPLGPLNLYGVKWLGAGQVATLTAANVSTSAARNDPCQVQLSLVGADGKPATNADGQPLVSQVALAPGGSTSLLTRAPSNTNSASRLAMRPVVQRIGAPGVLTPQCHIAVSFEVIDGSSGATQVFSPQDPTVPRDAFQPQDPFIPYPVAFAPTGVIAGQTMRVSVVNNTPTVIPGTPCIATLGFADDQGRPIPVNGAASSEVTLAPGAMTFLDLPAPATAVGVQNRAMIRPVVTSSSVRCQMHASADIFRSDSGASVVAAPQDPMLPPGQLSLVNLYGMKTVGPGQVARLTAANLSPTATRNDTCHIQLKYVDGQGLPALNPNGQPIVTDLSLAPGASTTLDAHAPGEIVHDSISAGEVVTVNPTQLRPLVQRIAPPSVLAPQCKVIVGFEVLDGQSGATQLFIPTDPFLPPTLAQGPPI
jgi:hypothetical protein